MKSNQVQNRRFNAWAPLLASIIAASLLLSSSARADIRTEARRHFREGMTLVAQGHVEEGVAELELAYEILPHPNVLYNIGRAYAESGRYTQAVEYFRRYLDTDPQDRAEVHGFVSALEERIALIEAREQGAERAAVASAQEAATPENTGSASDEEIATLESAATQIEALAESSQSDALRERASRLRALAQSLRQDRGAAGQEPVASETGGTEVTSSENVSTPETGDETSLQLGEEREGDTYEETVVSSSRAAQSPLNAPNSTTIITAQDLRLSGLNNPAETLRRVAGVELMTLSPGDVQISIRGLNDRLNARAVVLVDGRSVYLDFLGTTQWTMLPVAIEDIERIEVIRGPASALYGADAFTGIINLITRPLGEGRSYISSGLGSHGQMRVAAGVTERVDDFRFRVSGGYEQVDLYSRQVGPDRVDVVPFARDPNLAFNRTWFNGEAQLRVSDGLTLRAGTGITTGNRTFQGVGRLRELVMQDGLLTQTFIQAQTDIGLSARVFWNRFNTDFGAVANRPGGLAPAENGEVRRQDVIDGELVYTNSFAIGGVTNQVIGGLGYRFKEIDWSWLEDPIDGNSVYTQHHFNVFLQDTIQIDEVVQVVLSGRLDQHPLLSEPQISPRGSVIVHPTPRQSIRLTGGTAFRSPTFAQSYVHLPNATPLRGVTALGVGDLNLNPERMVSVELGYMLQEFDFFALEANVYYNLVFDEILVGIANQRNFRLHDYANDPRLAFNQDWAAQPLGEITFVNEAADLQQIGGELGLRLYPVDGLDIYVNYAIHETSDLGNQLSPGRAADSRTSAHKFNAGVQYRAPFGLDLSVDFHLYSDQVWSELELNGATGTTSFVPRAIPSYAIMNARIGYRLFDDQLEVAVAGTNLLMSGHRQHPAGQKVDRRFMGTVTFRY